MHARAARLLVTALFLAPPLAAQVTTQRIATGLVNPLWAGAPDGDERIFIVEQGGRIRILKNGALLATPFLDLSAQVSGGSEQGLLGLAFHPSYASNGRFYVNYTNLSGNTVVARYFVSADPNVADASSGLAVMSQAQPFTNHNGGDLHFGPDGYLYLFFGDGGSANDPNCRAQKLDTRLGKILRVDVDTAAPWVAPADNPFVGVTGALKEIYHIGLRNPWRNSFDRLTGDLYIGDVGQDEREEIDFAPAGVSGLNFGWKMMEGTRCNSTISCLTGTPACNDAVLKLPIAEHQRSAGASCITGGYVYRGCAVPSEFGKYFYSDYNNHKLRSLEYDPLTGLTSNMLDRTAELDPLDRIRNLSSFGEDGFGELLIVDGSPSGELYKMVPASAAPATAALRNGSGVNREAFSSASRPILGNVWEARVDVTPHAGATASLLVAFSAPSSGTFLAGGELLVDLGSSKLFTLSRVTSGTVDVFRSSIPCDASLNGVTAYIQAFVLGGGVEFCNARDVQVGYY